MAYPNGQGNLAQIWQEYLIKYAEKEGDVEGQVVIAAYHLVEVLTLLSRMVDRNARYGELIDQRSAYFHQGSGMAEGYMDCLINATFSIYNSLNTLCHQCTEGNVEASTLIRTVDEQLRFGVDTGEPAARPAAALRACFPLISLIALVLDQGRTMTSPIRQVEQRFAAGARAASSDWEHMVNALYRVVEVMQILALLTAPELLDRVNSIASRFKEEDRSKELLLKLRNGFCRFFELAHLLATQTDAQTT